MPLNMRSLFMYMIVRCYMGDVCVQKTGMDIATALNNMDVSSEYVLKLKHQIEEQYCAEVLSSFIYLTMKFVNVLRISFGELNTCLLTAHISYALYQ